MRVLRGSATKGKVGDAFAMAAPLMEVPVKEQGIGDVDRSTEILTETLNAPRTFRKSRKAKVKRILGDNNHSYANEWM